jgi:phosphatidylglycerol:prolipoprotein diacylglycerol transferase
MYPILYQNSWIMIPAWHAAFAVANVVAYLLFQRNIRRSVHPPLFAEWIFYFIVYGCGVFGARLFSWWVEESDPRSDFFAWTSFTLWGGLIAGASAGLIYLWIKRISVLQVADWACAPVLVAIGIGRIGCFLNGDDFGIPVTLQPTPWWAVTFPYHDLPIPRVPVQLLESLGCIWLGSAFLLHSKIPSQKKGVHAFLAVFAYSTLRFNLEFLRGDDRGAFWYDALSPSQWLSLFAGAAAAAVLSIRFFQK